MSKPWKHNIYLWLRLDQNSKDSALLTNQQQCTAKGQQETIKRFRVKRRTEAESQSRSGENHLANQCPPWTQGNTRFEPCGARRVNLATINAQLSSIPDSIDSNHHPSSLTGLEKEKTYLFPGIKIIYLSLLSYKKILWSIQRNKIKQHIVKNQSNQWI